MIQVVWVNSVLKVCHQVLTKNNIASAYESITFNRVYSVLHYTCKADSHLRCMHDVWHQINNISHIVIFQREQVSAIDHSSHLTHSIPFAADREIGSHNFRFFHPLFLLYSILYRSLVHSARLCSTISHYVNRADACISNKSHTINWLAMPTDEKYHWQCDATIVERSVIIDASNVDKTSHRMGSKFN